MAEATSAISETERALRHLDAGQPAESLVDLARASAMLDSLLARQPPLRLAPAALMEVTQELQGGVDTVQRVRRQAQELTDEGRPQDAGRLLRTLASETVIRVSNIPLATYPEGIAKAITLIEQHELNAAKQVLLSALSTQVITETIIPLPLAHALESLAAAEALAREQHRNPADTLQLQGELDRVRQELEFAQSLGYGAVQDFDWMYQRLNHIKERTAGDKSVNAGLVELRSFLSRLLESQRSPKP